MLVFQVLYKCFYHETSNYGTVHVVARDDDHARLIAGRSLQEEDADEKWNGIGDIWCGAFLYSLREPKLIGDAKGRKRAGVVTVGQAMRLAGCEPGTLKGYMEWHPDVKFKKLTPELVKCLDKWLKQKDAA